MSGSIGENKPANLTLNHTDEVVERHSATTRSELGASTPPWVTLPNSRQNDPPRSQPTQSAPEVSIDPEKSYLTTLPRELKLEIIDHIYGHPTAFVKDPTEAAFSKRLNLANLRLLVHVHRSGVSQFIDAFGPGPAASSQT